MIWLLSHPEPEELDELELDELLELELEELLELDVVELLLEELELEELEELLDEELLELDEELLELDPGPSQAERTADARINGISLRMVFICLGYCYLTQRCAAGREPI